MYGVNPGGAQSHAGFRAKHAFPFPLLVDGGQAVARQYHAHGLLVKRTVYLIGPAGDIRFSERGMPTPAQILAAAQ